MPTPATRFWWSRPAAASLRPSRKSGTSRWETSCISRPVRTTGMGPRKIRPCPTSRLRRLAVKAAGDRADGTMEGQRDEKRAFCFGLGYGRAPFGELGRAERGLDALVSGMRAGAGIGRQLRRHVYILETGVTEALVEAAIRAPFGACQAVRERGDFHLQLSAHGDIDERLHINRPDDDPDTPTRPGDAHHFTEHPVSVQEFHNGRRHRHVEATVRKGQDFRVADRKSTRL